MRLVKLLVWVLIFLSATASALYFLPETKTIPVAGAGPQDWNHQSFWYEPWGRSGVHKGIDIFAAKGQAVLSTTHGIVLATGFNPVAGYYVLVLGLRFQTHYYAHLDAIDAHVAQIVRSGQAIGTVGDTGNAAGRPAHLHYSIVRLIPDKRYADNSTQGHKKAYYVNPHSYLLGTQ